MPDDVDGDEDEEQEEGDADDGDVVDEMMLGDSDRL